MLIFAAFSVIFLSETAEVNGVRCYSCSSNSDRKCIWTQNDAAKTINCDVNCVNAILPDKSLFRGCSSDLPMLYPKEERCSTDLCNGNIFPRTRLACYHCFGSECAHVHGISKGDLQLCQNYVENDTCYTDVKSSTSVTRGCSSDGHQLLSASTTKCHQSYCNDEPAMKQLICWECDSEIEDEVACKMGREKEGLMGKCEMNVFLGQEGFCYVWHQAEYIRRGCSNDNLHIKEDKDIITCEKSLCNDQNMLISQCYSCDSEDKCMELDGIHGVQAVTCAEKTSSCFVCRDFGNVIHRGCGQPNQCIGACFPCWSGPLCNANKLFECYSCDSANDPHCELIPDPNMIDQEICDKGCEVRLKDDIIYRSCVDESHDCSEEKLCSRCYQDNCNNFYIEAECGVVEYSKDIFSTEEEDEVMKKND